MGAITGGPLFEELKTLYLRYCEITRFSLGNREIYAFSVDYETRHTDQNYGTHLCYWLQFSPKDRLSFSVRKAVDEIAKAAAAEQQ